MNILHNQISLTFVSNFFIKYIKIISISIVILLLLIFVFKWYVESCQAKIHQAANELGTLVVKYKGAERLAALKVYLSTAPKTLYTWVRLEIIRSAIDQEDWPLAIAMWKELALRADSTLAVIVSLGQVQSFLAIGQPKEALNILETAFPIAHKAFSGIFQQLMAQVAEATYDYKRSITLYQGLMQSVDIQMKTFLEDKIARLYEKMDYKG